MSLATSPSKRLLRISIAGVIATLAAAPAHRSTAGEPRSYTAPGVEAQRSTQAQPDTQLTARAVTQRLFQAAPGSKPELGGLNLTRLDLADLDFKQAGLDGTDLYGADLSRANLKGASLVGARLDSVTMTSADFSGADLTDARSLRPTIFTTLEVETPEAPRFTGAKLVRFRSDGCLDRADFEGADLTDAILGRAAAREPSVNAPARLVSANFTRAILKNAKLTGTSLAYARFIDADLSGANLIGTNLTKADFRGANVAGADFTGANLDEADLRGAKGLDKAVGLAAATNLSSAQRDPKERDPTP